MTRALFLLLSLAAAPLMGCGSQAPAAANQEQLWTCSMHPQVMQPEAGSCPICGMDLVPMSAAEPSEDLYIDARITQQMGVRTALVERTTVFKHLRTIGEVDVAEDQVSVVNLRLSGWAERVVVDRTGDPVKRGQVLFHLYSPDLIAAQDDYILAVKAQGAESSLAQAARRRLELWGIASRDLNALAKAGASQRTLPVRAPANGFVLHKNVVEGASVQAGQDLYRIGNLKEIWVNAEIYEFDAPWVEEGQKAQMEPSFMPNTVLEGRVAYIYPTLNPKSRTLRVRLEFENSGIELKPGMFATVHIEYKRQDDVIAIPSEAIVRASDHEIVFVQEGPGKFAPREVQTGLVGDRDLTEIRSGLVAGEEIVLSGQFLLDSESQMQEALLKLRGVEKQAVATEVEWTCPMHPDVISDEPGRCPECGMDLVEQPKTAHEHGYICPMHPEVTSDEPGRCPKCGMFLVEE